MTAHKLPPRQEHSASLRENCAKYDAIIFPKLAGLSVVTSFVSAIGIAGQFQSADFDDYALAALFGFSLWLICSGFWYGAWQAPVMSYKNPTRFFGFMVVAGFCGYAGISVTANFTATAGKAAVELTQQRTINAFDNAGAEAASFVREIGSAQAATADRATQAARLQRLEADGGGPTGVAGRGSVYNAYGLSHGTYTQAAELIATMLKQAERRMAALQVSIAELRQVQADSNLNPSEKEVQIKILSAKTLDEMRGLLALDPIGTLREAAASIARGVPPQSGAPASSQARINEISADMRRYAQNLEGIAERLSANTPALPSQVTLSTTEQLWASAASLPALTALALLLDLSGFIFCGFRLALYRNLNAKVAEEDASDAPTVLLVEDILNTEFIVQRAAEARARIESARAPSKRGRPRKVKSIQADTAPKETKDG
ncbi:MAG: hypothetical protein AAGB07_00715 [Pseudomonadota bacterium]